MLSAEQEEDGLNRLQEQCSGATLVVNNNMYRRMRLSMPGVSGTVDISIIVSAMHKLMRRCKSGELVYMLGCFFEAISKHDGAGDPQAAQYKAGITRVINRFAVTVFEEGGFLLIDDEGRKQVVRGGRPPRANIHSHSSITKACPPFPSPITISCPKPPSPYQ